MANQYTLKVYPEGLGRSVYRVMEVPGSFTLDKLCESILQSFDFIHEHMYEFCMDGEPYSRDSYQSYPENGERDTKITLNRLGLKKDQKFLFHYDFGDDWIFTIHVQDITEGKATRSAKVVKERGGIEQYPDWDDEDEEDYVEIDMKACQAVNDQMLAMFEEEMKQKGLSASTINRHLNNAGFYINEFVLEYNGAPMEEGVTMVGEFLGNFFIRKCMWSTPSNIKTTATSIKKFYHCMMTNEKISREEYEFICSVIQSDMAEWQADCAQFNDPGAPNPFLFF